MNLSNILNQKSVQSNIPPYFQNKESPCISYSYTRSVASKIFNYKISLQQIDFNSLSKNPLPCTCLGTKFLYTPCGNVVTGDLSIVQNDKLRDLLRKGPKFREPVSFTWHQNFDIIMDACEAYARQWTKKEDVELDTLSEWIKSIGEVVKRRNGRLKHSVNTRSESIFRDPDVVRELSRLHENVVIVLADKASNNYTFVCKRHYVDILIEELGSIHFLETLHTIWQIFLHQRGWTTTNRSSPPSEYRQIVRSSICRTIIGFLRCTKIHINIDWLRVHRSVRPSLYRFFSQNCLRILKGLQKYCETAYSRSGVNQMWILKNSKEVLDHLNSYHNHQVFWFFDPLHNHSSTGLGQDQCPQYVALWWKNKVSWILIIIISME